jgi:2-desacetyl-2-hydroxyethyl bacteriochlorophyllide A dehydrogenase
MTEHAVRFTAPGEVTVAEVERSAPGPGEVAVETAVSGISPGTETLVYRGDVPDELPADTELSTIEGDMSFPVEYGYAAAGRVVETGKGVAADWLDRRVLAFHPHRTQFCAATDHVVALPEGVSTEESAMLPSVETATNLVLDAGPRVGERAVVFGAGVIGLCTTAVLSAFPLESLVVVEPIPARRERAVRLGADRAVTPEEASTLFEDGEPDGADLAIEVSGQPTTLDDAIAAVGFDSRIVVGSWYGSKTCDLDLGGRFHRDRLDIVSSQVSTIASGLRGRWSKDRRLATALNRLRQLDTAAIITDRLPVERAAEAFERLESSPEDTLQVLLSHHSAATTGNASVNDV